MPVITEVKIVITMPIINAPSNSNRSGIHNQDIIPTINIGNNTYIYKAFIKSPSKKFFIFNSLFILFYKNNIKDIHKKFKYLCIFLKFITKYIDMETIIDGYKFTIEENNANNIILENVNMKHSGNIIDAIKQFILFLHKNKVQYVTIYDIKKQDRYKNILLYIYKNANNTEKWLYDMATFIYDGDVIRCKVY